MKVKKVEPLQVYNKKACFDYEILESLEAGIVLTGDEIKAIRAKRVNLAGSYVRIITGEVFWVGGLINVYSGDTQRTRKLLLKKDQISKLIGKSAEQGLSLIPLKLYLTRGRAKLELGVGRGLKKHDKRQKLKEKDIARDSEQQIKL